MSVMLSPANRLTACRSSGAAAPSPSVFSSDRPASSSSDGPGCGDWGRSLAARLTSAASPAANAAIMASR